MYSEQDKVLLAKKGISEEKLQQMLQMFRSGFPYLELDSAATPGHGILIPTATEQESYIGAWEEYTGNAGHKVVKFVPASGAASRMFKDLFAFLDSDHDLPEIDIERSFFSNIAEAPFADALNAACQQLWGQSISELVAAHRHKDVVRTLLSAEGLHYGLLPKGLLFFHKYQDHIRTPFEEHLVEGALYARQDNGDVHVHFTVSPEHRALFEALKEKVVEEYEKRYNVKYHISFSEQKPSTDTVAANADNTPFRQADGSLLFRPGGHGALIENLNDIDADVIFVKNIDNVVPDALKDDTVRWKKILGGILVSAQEQIFCFLDELADGEADEERMQEMLVYLENTLCCRCEAAHAMEGLELLDYLYCKFNRPLRVCGMVRNVGEPGGGPFLAQNADGSVSPQILESSQIDMTNERSKAMFCKGTHFNPVDLVCGVRGFEDEHFHLPDYVDPATGFISHKSKDGRELKALELPGLWNGAMSDWNTIFVEVPLTTFNPVKTVADLFREEHRKSEE